jgi:hypothetical protein
MERWTNRRDAEHGARRGPMPPSGQRS